MPKIVLITCGCVCVPSRRSDGYINAIWQLGDDKHNLGVSNRPFLETFELSPFLS